MMPETKATDAVAGVGGGGKKDPKLSLRTKIEESKKRTKPTHTHSVNTHSRRKRERERERERLLNQLKSGRFNLIGEKRKDRAMQTRMMKVMICRSIRVMMMMKTRQRTKNNVVASDRKH